MENRRINLSRYRVARARVGHLRRFARDNHFPATKIFASKNNTNFLFRIEGEIDDELAAEFNGMFDARGNKQVVATARRMRLLKDRNCKLVFERAVEPAARRNLAMVGGREMSSIIAEMLRHYYYDGEGAAAYCSKAIPIAGGNEGFFVLPLDDSHCALSAPVLVSLGDPTTTVIQPSEVFAAALKADAKFIILAHNHPSGNPTPSVQDRELTAALVSLGDQLGVKVLDHLVIGGENNVSLLAKK